MKEYVVLHRTLIDGKYYEEGFLVKLPEEKAKKLKASKLIADHKEAPQKKGRASK